MNVNEKNLEIIVSFDGDKFKREFSKRMLSSMEEITRELLQECVITE
jgi:hypothetical protein